MSRRAKLTRKKRVVLSVLFLLPPIIMFVAYVIVGIKYSYMSQADKVDTVLGFLPFSLRTTTFFFVVSTIFCLISMIIASKSHKKKSLSSRLKMISIVFVALFLILYNIGQFLL